MVLVSLFERSIFVFADNLGVYLTKDKAQPAIIIIYDFLAGKTKQVNVDELAAR